MNDVKIIKSVDIPKRSGLSLDDVEKLQLRFQSATGQQQSVFKEVFHHLVENVRWRDKFEQRLAALENK